MNETSRISSSRALHGSRPSTDNFPSYDVRPRIALSAVALPATLGPMSPRMRPSSTRRSTLSNATVVPKTLRRPCASIVAIKIGAPPCCSCRRLPSRSLARRSGYWRQTYVRRSFVGPTTNQGQDPSFSEEETNPPVRLGRQPRVRVLFFLDRSASSISLSRFRCSFRRGGIEFFLCQPKPLNLFRDP